MFNLQKVPDIIIFPIKRKVTFFSFHGVTFFLVGPLTSVGPGAPLRLTPPLSSGLVQLALVGSTRHFKNHCLSGKYIQPKKINVNVISACKLWRVN